MEDKETSERFAYFIGAGACRRDWDVVAASIINYFENKGLCAVPLLATKEIFGHYSCFPWAKNSVVLEGGGGWRVPLSCIFYIFVAVLKSGRGGRWSSYKKAIKACALLRKLNVRFVIGLNFSDYPEVVAACKSLDLRAISLQHGDYYLGGAKWQTLHEWPTTDLCVWSVQDKAVLENKWREVRFFVTGEVWKIRYLTKDFEVSDRVVIYESAPSEFFSLFCLELVKCLDDDSVAIKPHPYLYKHGKSVVGSINLLGRGRVEFDYIFDRRPKVVVSFGSSVAYEAIYCGIPVVSITDDFSRLPSLGVFPPHKWRDALELVVGLKNGYQDINSFISQQRSEVLEIIGDENGESVLRKIFNASVSL